MSLTSVDLPGAGHPGDRDQPAERDVDVDVVQVVLARPDDRELALLVERAPVLRHRDRAPPGQVRAGQRRVVRLEVLDAAAVHDVAAVLARARTDVDGPVAGADRVLVVLDDDQRVPQVPQPGQRVDQPAVVPLVQTDRRLVEHVEHPDQPRADLRGQPDPLRLATGERARRAVQRQVLQPDVEQEPEPRLDLLEHPSGDHGLALVEHHAVEELRAVGDRHRRDLGDGAVAVLAVGERDGQDLGLEPGAVAGGARHVAHVALVPLALGLRLGLVQAPVEERDHALEVRVVGALAAVPVAVADVHLVLAAVQHGLLRGGRQLAPRRVHPEADRRRQPGEQPAEVLRVVPAGPRRDRAVGQAEIGIGDDQLRVDLLLDPDAGARRAGAVGRVERERAGLEVVQRQRVPVRARHPLGEPALAVRVVLLEVDELEHDQPVGQPQRRLDRVGQPLLGRRLHREPVDDDGDVVLLLLLQLRRLGQRVHGAVDQHAGVALPLQRGEQVDELALAGAHDGGQHLEPGALLHRQHLVHDLLRRLLLDHVPAGRAVRHAGARVEQAQVVVHLGDRADGRARVAVRRLLVDRHRRGQALDEVDVRLVHLAEELPGVRRERLDVPALALGEDRVEREARLPGPGQAGEHDHAVAREVEIDALQVVLAGAAHDQPRTLRCARRRHGRADVCRRSLGDVVGHGARLLSCRRTRAYDGTDGNRIDPLTMLGRTPDKNPPGDRPRCPERRATAGTRRTSCRSRCDACYNAARTVHLPGHDRRPSGHEDRTRVRLPIRPPRCGPVATRSPAAPTTVCHSTG